MTQFTKGPWAANVPPSSSGFGRAIVAVRDDGPDVFVAYVGNWKQDPAVEDADAKLIAAAPEMLEALYAFRDEFGDIIESDDELPGADAVDAIVRVWPLVKGAIAMATGGRADAAPIGHVERAPKPREYVHVLTVDHRHGTNISAYRDDDAAQIALSAYCQEWWADARAFCDALPTTTDGMETHEIIQAYFDASEDEFYTIERVEVEG